MTASATYLYQPALAAERPLPVAVRQVLLKNEPPPPPAGENESHSPRQLVWLTSRCPVRDPVRRRDDGCVPIDDIGRMRSQIQARFAHVLSRDLPEVADSVRQGVPRRQHPPAARRDDATAVGIEAEESLSRAGAWHRQVIRPPQEPLDRVGNGAPFYVGEIGIAGPTAAEEGSEE